MHNYCGFFSQLFFSLKLMFCLIFFIKIILSFQWKCVSKIIFVILYFITSRKVGMQHSHFAISTNFLMKKQSVKVKNAWSSKFDGLFLSSSARIISPDLNFLNHLLICSFAKKFVYRYDFSIHIFNWKEIIFMEKIKQNANF